MGIRGLTTYINQNADVCLQDYGLHDSYLVIDGNSIASQLYNITYQAKTNSCFGGDYDIYANCVSNFFEDLLKCKITPLIIIDGGAEEKKMTTSYQRAKEKLKSAYNMGPGKQSQIFPLLLKEVFKSVLLSKQIKCAYSLFEADEDIASVARILNCPVLSLDSDFYIFDVMYVPFNTLEDCVRRNPNGSGYVKYCKMFKIDYFLQMFPGMQKTVIPLAATLLGNDYIDSNTFKDFFSTLKLPKGTAKRYNDQQRRIAAVFRWLQEQTLDSAIARVLSRIESKMRSQILKLIELVVNGYLIASPRMLKPLGFSSDYVNMVMQKVMNRPYKFQEDIYKLQVNKEPKADDEMHLSYNEDHNSSPKNFNIVKHENEINFYRIAPEWFVTEFQTANFPSYFIDIVTRQKFLCPVQIEDFSQPTCFNISLKIIKVIFKLLNSDNRNNNTLEYIARAKLTSLATFKLHCEDNVLFGNLPFSELRSIPMTIRKQMLHNTLGVTSQLLNSFPPGWELYMATIKYWINETEPIIITNCHLYALLFASLYHVIDGKIGFCRSKAYFNRKFNDEIKLLQNQNNVMTYPAACNMPFYDALSSVTAQDCLLAMPFFLENFTMCPSLQTNPKKFNISIVHSFSLLQNCLRHSMHLNALLGYPYKPVCIAQFFNGTLLYNLYNNFKSRNNIDNYIQTILKDSPTLLQAFVSLLTLVKPIFTKAFDKEVNSMRRKKHKKKHDGYSS